MCGIAGIVNLRGEPVPNLERALGTMNRLLAHRGPDDEGTWRTARSDVGLAHRRLSIIDLSKGAKQPMRGINDTVITYNGEIYNYLELGDTLSGGWTFRTSSDTETILAVYARKGDDCLSILRGMFAFALWDNRNRRLLCARDRFGIKPFYYAIVGDCFLFASETKALLPFLPTIESEMGALAEYLTFQYTIGEQTMFKGVKQLLPGHALAIENGDIKVWRYWDVRYEIDFDHSPVFFEHRLKELLQDSLHIHLRADVPIGSYLSGGIDSSLIAILAAKSDSNNKESFHGKFTAFPGYDESEYARLIAENCGNVLHEIDITANEFVDHISDVIYHLDFPVAGPGSFPQYMVSRLASRHVKVVLGGQGGDEIFGGYARYLLAYFEQCIKAAIDGTYKNGNFVVTIDSIVPNLGLLREYTPLMREFWRDGLFGSLDERYLRLVDRSTDVVDEIDWSMLDKERVIHDFRAIFNNNDNVCNEAYFDKMTHFDFKCLLPALLHVEDRMSMAHGLESRVPLLDHPLIEFAATVPADVKFEGGRMKHLLKRTFADVLPASLLNRRDKMGFPVPLKEWGDTDLRDFVNDTFNSHKASTRPYMNIGAVRDQVNVSGRFSRKMWGLLSLELWHQRFHDRASYYRALVGQPSSSERSAVATRV